MLFNEDFVAGEMFPIDDFIDVDVVEKAETRSQNRNSPTSEQAESNEVSRNTDLPEDTMSNIVLDSCINNYKDVVNLLKIQS